MQLMQMKMMTENHLQAPMVVSSPITSQNSSPHRASPPPVLQTSNSCHIRNESNSARPNAEFVRQSNDYKKFQQVMVVPPTVMHSRRTSQHSSSGMSPHESQNSALASQVAYGQAQTRKQTEFEKIVNGGSALGEHHQAVILLERQGSDCLAATEIDEQNLGGMKLPLLNK